MFTKRKEKKLKDLEGLKSLSLWLLGQRDYSIANMEKKLREWAQDRNDVDLVITSLLELRYLDDARYAESRVRSKAEVARWGPMRIKQDLKLKGVGANDIENAFIDYDEEYWLERISELYDSKYRGTPPADYKERDKRTRFLVGRGFSFDLIKSVIEDPESK